jgi:hypothetical protein
MDRIVYTYWLSIRVIALLCPQGTNYFPRQCRGK